MLLTGPLLADRTYLITGGGSGIGKGVAAAVVASGGNAMLVGRNADKLAAAADEINAGAGEGAGSVLYEPADVTNEDEVARAVEVATAWTGRLHGVVHCAGGSDTIGPLTQLDSEAWRRRIVRRHLVDRGEQHPPVVRRLRRLEGGGRSPDDAGGR